MFQKQACGDAGQRMFANSDLALLVAANLLATLAIALAARNSCPALWLATSMALG